MKRSDHKIVQSRDNNNPPLEVVATNFFNIRFYRRLTGINQSKLTPRQFTIYQIICNSDGISKRNIAIQVGVSEDTVLRELHCLIKLKLIVKKGVGKATSYFVKP